MVLVLISIPNGPFDCYLTQNKSKSKPTLITPKSHLKTPWPILPFKAHLPQNKTSPLFFISPSLTPSQTTHPHHLQTPLQHSTCQPPPHLHISKPHPLFPFQTTTLQNLINTLKLLQEIPYLPKTISRQNNF